MVVSVLDWIMRKTVKNWAAKEVAKKRLAHGNNSLQNQRCKTSFWWVSAKIMSLSFFFNNIEFIVRFKEHKFIIKSENARKKKKIQQSQESLWEE